MHLITQRRTLLLLVLLLSLVVLFDVILLADREKNTYQSSAAVIPQAGEQQVPFSLLFEEFVTDVDALDRQTDIVATASSQIRTDLDKLSQLSKSSLSRQNPQLLLTTATQIQTAVSQQETNFGIADKLVKGAVDKAKRVVEKKVIDPIKNRIEDTIDDEIRDLSQKGEDELNKREKQAEDKILEAIKLKDKDAEQEAREDLEKINKAKELKSQTSETQEDEQIIEEPQSPQEKKVKETTEKVKKSKEKMEKEGSNLDQWTRMIDEFIQRELVSPIDDANDPGAGVAREYVNRLEAIKDQIEALKKTYKEDERKGIKDDLDELEHLSDDIERLLKNQLKKECNIGAECQGKKAGNQCVTSDNQEGVCRNVDFVPTNIAGVFDNVCQCQSKPDENEPSQSTEPQPITATKTCARQTTEVSSRPGENCVGKKGILHTEVTNATNRDKIDARCERKDGSRGYCVAQYDQNEALRKQAGVSRAESWMCSCESDTSSGSQ